MCTCGRCVSAACTYKCSCRLRMRSDKWMGRGGGTLVFPRARRLFRVALLPLPYTPPSPHREITEPLNRGTLLSAPPPPIPPASSAGSLASTRKPLKPASPSSHTHTHTHTHTHAHARTRSPSGFTSRGTSLGSHCKFKKSGGKISEKIHFKNVLKGTYYENPTFLVLLYVNLGIWHVSQHKNAGKKQVTRLVVVPLCQKRYA